MNTTIRQTMEIGGSLRTGIVEMVARYTYPTNKKSLLMMAYHSILVEYHESVHLLIQHQKYGCAFALVRPMHETLYRAHWVNGCATPYQIKRLFAGRNVFPKMHQMVKDIDSAYGTDTFWKTLKDGSWSAMSDYTHSGIRQLTRRMKNDEVAPNYDHEEVIDVLNGSNMALLMMSFLFFTVFKMSKEAITIGEMIVNYPFPSP